MSMSRHKARWLKSVLTSCIFLLALYIPPALAEQQTSISVSQSVIDIGGGPGDRLEAPFTITNNSDIFLPISIVVRPAIQNSGPLLRPDRSAETFTMVDEPQFIVNPNQSKTVTVIVDIPQDIGPGGYYADIVTRALILDDPTRLTTALPELATSLFVTVSGEADQSHAISQQQSSIMLLNAGQQKPLRFTIENTGNVHSLFTPTLIIARERDDELTQEATPVLLLPGEKTQLEFVISGDDLGIGAYDTELRYSFGTPAEFIAEPSSRIIVTPFSLFWGVTAGAIIIVLVLFRVRKRIYRAFQALLHGSVPS